MWFLLGVPLHTKQTTQEREEKKTAKTKTEQKHKPTYQVQQRWFGRCQIRACWQRWCSIHQCPCAHHSCSLQSTALAHSQSRWCRLAQGPSRLLSVEITNGCQRCSLVKYKRLIRLRIRTLHVLSDSNCMGNAKSKSTPTWTLLPKSHPRKLLCKSQCVLSFLFLFHSFPLHSWANPSNKNTKYSVNSFPLSDCQILPSFILFYWSLKQWNTVSHT